MSGCLVEVDGIVDEGPGYTEREGCETSTIRGWNEATWEEFRGNGLAKSSRCSQKENTRGVLFEPPDQRSGWRDVQLTCFVIEM